MSAWVLAFDTATEALAIAVGRRDGNLVELVASHDGPAPRAAMSNLLPETQHVLADAGRGMAGIDEIVVGRGPGSFTGVRIGVATAKGLAQGLGVPLFGVGTLDAIAWRIPAEESGLVGVVGDAMRGEVYPALFRARSGGPVRVGEDRVDTPGDAAARWALLEEGLTLAGNGLAKHSQVFTEAIGTKASVADEALWPPTGAGLLAAYAAALADGSAGPGDPAALLPVYTRLSDAEEAERRRAGLPIEVPPSDGVRGPGDGA